MSETLKWVDADGTAHDLTDANGARVLKGVEGRFMPPVSFIEEEIPFQPGARLRLSKTGPREVVLPLFFQAEDETELRAALRAWLYRLNVDRGAGKLRVTGPDGGIRDLNAIYAGGMEIVEDGSTSGADWQKAVVVFRAVDPYWYDQADVTQAFSLSSPSNFFPFFPMHVSSSEVNSLQSVNNGGDVDAWPTWEIEGPCTSLSLSNLTTGETLELSTTLIAGQSISIDTRPGFKTVEGPGGSLYSAMTADSSLWSLARGLSSVLVGATGATVETQILLRFKRRYLGA